ncbi:hypothetical protein ABZ642_14705 [Streptomyces sp. NPDC007157]|uniref:hypothetical protein n=1 Tax=Streptomyces sp. NPDC007157 TaxID=3154681 RepID=UPI0033C5F985
MHETERRHNDDGEPAPRVPVVPDQPSALLRKEMNRELVRWRRATLNYGVSYYVSRASLIIASAVVAADQNLADGKGTSIVQWVPVLALLVAILAALDTWLKPQQKWRGFMESRDKLASLMILAEHGLGQPEVRARFDALRAEHREKNIF